MQIEPIVKKEAVQHRLKKGLSRDELLILSSDEDIQKVHTTADLQMNETNKTGTVSPGVQAESKAKYAEYIMSLDARYLYDYLYDPPVPSLVGKLQNYPLVIPEEGQELPIRSLSGLLKEERDMKREGGYHEPFVIEILDDSFELKKERFSSKMEKLEGKIEKKEEDDIGTPKSEEIDFELLGITKKVSTFDQDRIKGSTSAKGK